MGLPHKPYVTVPVTRACLKIHSCHLHAPLCVIFGLLEAGKDRIMGNNILKLSNIKKTYHYLKKNGVKNAYYAAMERLDIESREHYHYRIPEEDEIGRQRDTEKDFPYTFSILVPAYETPAVYLEDMTDSVLNQTYSKLELIIADASPSDTVEKIIKRYDDERIRYLRLRENKGISANTNEALKAACGDYIGLLDHDDILTPDALYEMARAIAEEEKSGRTAWLLYSDEDKCNADISRFYEPHFKPELNIDLLLSNNYICHFLMMKKELIKELGFRPEYDGAQDYDLVLRAVQKLLYDSRREKEEADKETDKAAAKERNMGRACVVHINKVLYHWRSHGGSTAENPESKRYAYEAGKRAAGDFLQRLGIKGRVEDTLHLGFYRTEYENDIFAQRPEVGVLGGKLLDSRKKIAGGVFNEDGIPMYTGLKVQYSGYMHRASVSQEAYAVDVRCMKVRKELYGLFEEVFGIPYFEDLLTESFDYKEAGYDRLPIEDKGLRDKSIRFCSRVREAGYTVVWDPEFHVQL